MIKFLIYLFESGMCLTLLFLVYYLFLRKETYFTFNRIYLISILIFSILFPILPISFTSPKSKVLEGQVQEIGKFKSYYENIIALTDPDYLQSFSKPFRENASNEFDEISGSAFSSRNKEITTSISEKNSTNIKTGFCDRINLSTILLIIYLLGILFFAGRLFLLFRWINQSIKKYGSTVENGVKMVKMDEEVPPFSFFRIIFLNRETTSFSGFGQIVAHEKVHIGQLHSIDLLLAHAITVFQWFNPFVWFINKAMKTNHEYIADRNVVEQGYELFDYQSLLLKQIISIRSVELVNNFNLINIKKRIAMMTKIKSGLAAQMKALVVIPSAIFLFFFFADVTFAQDAVGFENKDYSKELQGMWKNIDETSYGTLINFKDNNLQILEDVENFREFKYEFQKSSIALDENYFKTSILSKMSPNVKELASFMVSDGEHNMRPVNIHFKNNTLKIAWSSSFFSTYKRIEANNSLLYFSGLNEKDFKPVSTNYYRISENSDKAFFLFMNKKGQMLLDGERIDLENIENKIKEIKSKGNPFNEPKKFAVISVDARCEMASVNEMYRKLREMDQLLHILSVRPLDEKVPEIFYHNVGVPRLFPHKDAKLIDEDEIEKSGMEIIRIDLTKGITPEKAASIFQKEIQKDKKYVVLFSYKNETTYNEYLTILDEFYQSIFAKRNKLAQEKYNLGFDDLAKAQQKEIRKVYPQVLTEKNVDYQPE